MGFPATLPSPANGVAVSRRPLLNPLRSFLIKSVSVEPSDVASRITVAAAILPFATNVLASVLGASDQTTFLLLLRVPLVPVFSLLLIAQVSGLLSRSTTARFIAGLSTCFLAAGSLLVGTVALPPVVFDFATWVYKSSLIAALGLWAVRSLRRWLAGDAA